MGTSTFLQVMSWGLVVELCTDFFHEALCLFQVVNAFRHDQSRVPQVDDTVRSLACILL